MARTRNFETPTEGRTMTHVHGQGENHVADGVCRSYETSLLPARDRHPVSTFPRSNVLTFNVRPDFNPPREQTYHFPSILEFRCFRLRFNSELTLCAIGISIRNQLCPLQLFSNGLDLRGRKIGVQLGESREEAFVSHKWQRLGAQRPIERWSRGVPEKRRTRLHSRCKAKQARVIMRISYFETSSSPRASLLPARRPPLSRPP